MSKTRVVNKYKEDFDVYIGRLAKEPYHFGNPFTHLRYGLGLRKVTNRHEAVLRFRSWLEGKTDTDLEQARRRWILRNLHTLKGKRLGCFCHPKECHGDVLKELTDET